jgi:hypothetical protein
MAHIGRGEGAQAYGHGLYFAENEGVARSYRDALSARNQGRSLTDDLASLSIDGTPLMQRFPIDARSEVVEFAKANDQDGLQRLADEAIGRWRSVLDDSGYPFPDYGRERLSAWQGMRDALRAGSAVRAPGRMYEVGIHASPDEFLDWDAPLSAQSERARAALAPLLEQGRRGVLAKALEPDDPDVGRILAAARFEGGPANRPEEALRSAGIPGIRYLDQGSRSAGEGSRNYVVFDDSLIEILRKYGLPGMIGGGGMLGALSKAQQEQAA